VYDRGGQQNIAGYPNEDKNSGGIDIPVELRKGERSPVPKASIEYCSRCKYILMHS